LLLPITVKRIIHSFTLAFSLNKEEKMAFDQPIEADRIDDFNLFSAFFRAPLWILGGVLGKNGSDDVDGALATHRLDDNAAHSENSNPSSRPNTSKDPSRKRVVLGYDHATAGQQADDYSDDGAADNSSQRGCHPTSESDRWHGSVVSVDTTPLSGLPGAKSLSWSDASGRSLVEYNDEVSKKRNHSRSRFAA
jgi:hypothetical protein